MFGKNIREMRKEMGLSQKALADRIGATQGAVYFWEKEINEPTVGYLLSLAETFGVSVDELLTVDGGKKEEIGAKAKEMLALFARLTEKQRGILIDTAKEFLDRKDF